jgi:hypothetical protein
VALDTEFANRSDGLVGMVKLYDMNLTRKNIRQMDAGLVYTALRNGQVFAGLVYTTDGRLNAFNLKLLEDDKHYFPDYTAAPVVRQACSTPTRNWPQSSSHWPHCSTTKPCASSTRGSTSTTKARPPWPPTSCANIHSTKRRRHGISKRLFPSRLGPGAALTWQHITLVGIAVTWRLSSACRWAS